MHVANTNDAVIEWHGFWSRRGKWRHFENADDGLHRWVTATLGPSNSASGAAGSVTIRRVRPSDSLEEQFLHTDFQRMPKQQDYKCRSGKLEFLIPNKHTCLQAQTFVCVYLQGHTLTPSQAACPMEYDQSLLRLSASYWHARTLGRGSRPTAMLCNQNHISATSSIEY